MRLVLAVPQRWSFYCNMRCPSRVIPSVCAEFIESIWIWIGSVDAAHSCGSNGGRPFGIGWLVVEISSREDHCLDRSLFSPRCVLGHAMSFGYCISSPVDVPVPKHG
eukprot:scaffold338173_cov28-Attheya_sp.AAC.1